MFEFLMRPHGIRVYRRWTRPFCSPWRHLLIRTARLSPHWQRSPLTPALTNLVLRVLYFVSKNADMSLVRKENAIKREISYQLFTRSQAFRWMGEKLDSILWLVHECINLQCMGASRLVHGCIINKNHYLNTTNNIRARLQRGAPEARNTSRAINA